MARDWYGIVEHSEAVAAIKFVIDRPVDRGGSVGTGIHPDFKWGHRGRHKVSLDSGQLRLSRSSDDFNVDSSIDRIAGDIQSKNAKPAQKTSNVDS
jgi:hypothetical protein